MPARLRRSAQPVDPLAGLTLPQRLGVRGVLAEVRDAGVWSWDCPVLLSNRCWMRLDRIALNHLQRYLPPDGRDEAPELVHYRLLLADGVDPLMAQQACWHDFGMADCQRAQRDYWQSRKRHHHGWTARRYRQLVSAYRERIERCVVAVPMLVLAREGSCEPHQLHWISELPS